MVNFIGKLFRLLRVLVTSTGKQSVQEYIKNSGPKRKTLRLVMFKKLSHWPQVLVPTLAPWGPPPSPPRCNSSAPP